MTTHQRPVAQHRESATRGDRPRYRLRHRSDNPRVRGWCNISCQRYRVDHIVYGDVTPDEAAPMAANFGTVKSSVANVDDALRNKVLEALTQAYAEHTNAAGEVVLDSEVLIYRATSRSTTTSARLR